MALARASVTYLCRRHRFAGHTPELSAFLRKKHFLIERKDVLDQSEIQRKFLSPYEDILPAGQLAKEHHQKSGLKEVYLPLMEGAEQLSITARANEILGDEALKDDDFFNVKDMISVEEMMSAGVHFGHKAGTWCGAMKPFILGHRHKMHIFNLDETARHLQTALNVVSHFAYRKVSILFLNTRPQFQFMVQKTARECGSFFVTGRWVSGTLTNIRHLLNTTKLPGAIICLSVPTCKVALEEAAKMGVPTIGICDSDCNPGLLTYAIPGNDDGDAAMELYLRLFRDAIKCAKDRQIMDLKHFLETRGSVLDARGLSMRSLDLIRSAEHVFDDVCEDFVDNYKAKDAMHHGELETSQSVDNTTWFSTSQTQPAEDWNSRNANVSWGAHTPTMDDELEMTYDEDSQPDQSWENAQEGQSWAATPPIESWADGQQGQLWPQLPKKHTNKQQSKEGKIKGPSWDDLPADFDEG